MDESRIYGKKIDVSMSHVKEFWAKRTDREVSHRYNYALLSGDSPDPEVVLGKDRYEKELIAGIVGFRPDATVLDIGCGVGRWADYFREHGLERYVGVDFSEQMLRVARENFTGDSRFSFLRGSFQELRSVLEQNGMLLPFRYLFNVGVCPYINDEELEQAMSGLAGLMAPGAVLYLKETAGIKERLTLNNFDSKELGTKYTVIYRSLAELEAQAERCFPEPEFTVVRHEPLWPEELYKWKETGQYYWIIRKN